MLLCRRDAAKLVLVVRDARASKVLFVPGRVDELGQDWTSGKGYPPSLGRGNDRGRRTLLILVFPLVVDQSDPAQALEEPSGGLAAAREIRESTSGKDFWSTEQPGSASFLAHFWPLTGRQR
jgi:hypothetical protein